MHETVFMLQLVMKYNNFCLFLGVFLCVLFLIGCNAGGSSGSGAAIIDNYEKGASYAFGMMMGRSLRDEGIQINLKEFFRGFEDANRGGATRYTPDNADAILRLAFAAMQESISSNARNEGEEYLLKNRQKSGVIETSSGLQYEVLIQGEGVCPTVDDIVRVNYEGSLVNGQVFDSSFYSGDPVEFPLGQVIPGWIEGLQLMPEGSIYTFYIPWELAYGEQGAPPAIPPYSALIFKIELLEIVRD